MKNPQPGDLVRSRAWDDVYRLQAPAGDGLWSAVLVKHGGSGSERVGDVRMITPTGAGWVKVDAVGQEVKEAW